MAHTVFHTCSLCEATCGLAFEVEDDRIVVRATRRRRCLLQGLRLPEGHRHRRHPRRPGPAAPAGAAHRGRRVRADLLGRRVRSRGQPARPRSARSTARDAIGFYWGNPTGNNHGALLMLSSFTKALGTRNRFSAGLAGRQPAHRDVLSALRLARSRMPIPDIDRTDYFLCLGANPIVSNGSVMTAPDMRRRLRAIRERGGKVVVVDPRRTETAREADEHVAIRPGSDAALPARDGAGAGRARPRRPRSCSRVRRSGWAEIERRLGRVHAGARRGLHRRPGRRPSSAWRSSSPTRRAPCATRASGVCVGAARDAGDLRHRSPEPRHRPARPRGRGDVHRRRPSTSAASRA